MTGRSPLRRRRSALDCRAISEEEEEEEEDDDDDDDEVTSSLLLSNIVLSNVSQTPLMFEYVLPLI
jgi:hypothetical protein